MEGFAKEMALVTHSRIRMVDGKAKLEGEAWRSPGSRPHL